MDPPETAMLLLSNSLTLGGILGFLGGKGIFVCKGVLEHGSGIGPTRHLRDEP